MPIGENAIFRFGPFELDVECGQLRKDGLGVKLQGQPVQILQLLVENAGQLVTRDEFRRRLWSTDTFVDFEHSLNTAVKRLRQALGDEADTPHFIETIPKHGYRFIAEVSHTEHIQQTVPSVMDVDHNVDRIPATFAETTVAPGKSRSLLVWRVVAISSAALIALAATMYWITKPPLMPRIVGSHALTNTGFRKGFRVLTDGASIYFQENRPNHVALVQVRTRGGEASEIASLPDSAFLSDISKDGSELLLAVLDRTSNQFDAWVQPLPNGPPRLLVKDAWAPAWTSDNKSIVFARNRHTELYRANQDGMNLRRLAVFPDIAEIRVSPYDNRIRVGSNFIITNVGLLEMDPDGTSNPEPVLAEAQGDLSMGPWSPDGQFFFFLAWLNDRNDLWVMPEKRHWSQRGSGHPVQLTFGPASIGRPAISEDGKQLYAAALERHGELSVYDSSSRNFVPYLSGISACYVDFSRDGEWIAYVSYPEGALWRSRIDGSDKRRLTSPPLGVMNPRWSPDGKLIAFTNVASVARHSLEQKKWQIYIVSADGGGPMLLLEGVILNDPTWSPDGKSLAYGVGPVGSVSLNVLDLQTLTSTTVPGSENLSSPRWSPDGKYLAALELAYPEKKLMLYSFQTRQWEILASGALDWPSWSHDSRYVYVQDASSFIRIALATHKTEQVASLHGLHTAAYYFDRVAWGWFGLTPDDRPITTRDTGIEEIYAFDLEYK